MYCFVLLSMLSLYCYLKTMYANRTELNKQVA